jgi:hypothetical protein
MHVSTALLSVAAAAVGETDHALDLASQACDERDALPSSRRRARSRVMSRCAAIRAFRHPRPDARLPARV